VRFSIRFKLISYTFILVATAIVTLSWFSLVQQKNYVADSVSRRGSTIIELLSEEILDDVYLLQINEISDKLQAVLSHPEITYVYVSDTEGRILTDGTDEDEKRFQILRE